MQTIQRTTHEIDATGKTPGRLASEIAPMLIGKHRPDYTPHVDSGDFVQVVNASKMVVTGKKMEQKLYRRHSGFLGGLKETGMSKLWNESPAKVLRLIVSRMLPKNKLRNERMLRLTITD